MNKDLEEYMHNFENWYFAHKNKYRLYELGKMDFKPEHGDNMTFVTFRETTSKKQKTHKWSMTYCPIWSSTTCNPGSEGVLLDEFTTIGVLHMELT